MHRRQLFAVITSIGVGGVAYRLLGGSGMAARGVKWPRGINPVLTPPGDHYQVSKSFLLPDPSVDASRWRLDVYGLVSARLSLSLDDLRAMPAVEQPATLACIGNNIPPRAVGTALWKGVRLRDVLERAGGVDASAVDLVFTAADNYTDSIPVKAALDPDTLLAYDMNGAPLPRGHGAPLRAIVPGIYGMKNAKWIEGIEIVGGEYLGYWQQRGWSDAAPYQTMSRFDEPREGDVIRAGQAIEIGGMAFAGDRAIATCEWRIATREGLAPAWRAATLDPAIGPYTWVVWRATWTPPAPGAYVLQVRATDGTGAPQPEEQRPPFPDGATGLHTVTVEVV